MRVFIIKVCSFLIFCTSAASILAAQKTEIGMASYYADEFNGSKTASGETYDKTKMTAAHKTLSFGTVVRVTRLDDNRNVEVRITDRGPYVKGRIIELSRQAAQSIGLIQDGITKVKVDVLDKKTVDNSDKNKKETASKSTASNEKGTKEYEAPTVPGDINERIKKLEEEKKNASGNTRTNKADIPPPPPPVAIGSAGSPASQRATSKNYQEYDLFKISVQKPRRAGFGVQVVSLKDYRNVLRQIADLQETYYDNILLSVENDIDGLPIYKIIIGPFRSRQDAEKYKKDVKKKKKLNGFVVDLAAS